MLPREHGAYGQLLLPLITALAIGQPTVPAVTLSVAGVALFLAHEPLLVLTGQRGVRAGREQARRAQRWLAAYLAVGLTFGVAGIVTAPPWSRAALVCPIVLALVLAKFIADGREHTTAGEILSSVALSSLSLPVAVAATAAPKAAATCAIVFSSGFAMATISVRSIILGQRHQSGRWARGLPGYAAGTTLLLIVGLAVVGVLPAAAPWASVPISGLVIVLTVSAPSPRHLRHVGWSLVLATSVSAAILIAGLR